MSVWNKIRVAKELRRFNIQADTVNSDVCYPKEKSEKVFTGK